MKRDVTGQDKKLGNRVDEGTSSGYRWKLLDFRVYVVLVAVHGLGKAK
jgi:hypothetical protein